MSTAALVPSGYEIINSELSIEETFQVINEKKLSFLIVEDAQAQAVGMITLKDLVRNYEYLTDPEKLKKPIRLIMSQPLKSIAVEQMAEASQFMFDSQIRHLPVRASLDEQSEIVGVIDMECLLRTRILKEKMKSEVGKGLGVYSSEGSLFKVLSESAADISNVTVDRIAGPEMESDEKIDQWVQKYDFAILDISNASGLALPLKVLPAIMKHEKRLFLVIDPAIFKSQEQIEVVRDLAKRERIRIFKRPINIHELLFSCMD